MADRLKDKIALVFGAGSSGPGWGNGKAAAVAYAREGARVYAVDIDPDAAAETRDIIRGEGWPCEALTADVTKADQIKAAVDAVVAGAGRIDILHNNVGITEMGGPVEASEESWHRVIDTNLTSVFLCCKHVLPVMLTAGKGAIVNISSMAAVLVGRYPYFSYNTAKAGVNHITRAIAVQYAAQGIRANAIMPGAVDTPLIYKQIVGLYASPEEMVKARNAAIPMGKMGDAWDIANAAVFLASDEARFITGVCLPVDGGAGARG